MERSHLDIQNIMLLDKIQKRIPITREDHRELKALGLVEGRYPNIFIAGSIAELTGQTARHIRERGFNDQYYMDLILALLKEHEPQTRQEIDNLLIDKLPEVMSETQKKNKIHNLLSELVRRRRIQNSGPIPIEVNLLIVKFQKMFYLLNKQNLSIRDKIKFC